MSSFRQNHDGFNPEALALLNGVLDETWTALQFEGNPFDEAKTRRAIADLVIKFAAQGERDPQKLKVLVLAALPTYDQVQ
jgi:hypothetical protein